jgi:hypothetical protein
MFAFWLALGVRHQILGIQVLPEYLDAKAGQVLMYLDSRVSLAIINDCH